MVLNYFGLFYLSEQEKAFRGCYFSPTQKCSSRPIFAISFPFLDLINFIKEWKSPVFEAFFPHEKTLLYFFFSVWLFVEYTWSLIWNRSNQSSVRPFVSKTRRVIVRPSFFSRTCYDPWQVFTLKNIGLVPKATIGL